MRLLVLSNLYPPHYKGGYELGCRDVVEALRGRGHEVAVLTSTHGVPEPRVEGYVYRWLMSEWSRPSRRFFWYVRHAFRQEQVNRRAFREAVEGFGPDLLYVWNPAGISLSIVMMAEEMGLPVAYFVSDEWMTRWQAHQSWLTLWAPKPKRRLARYLRPALRAMARARRLPTWEDYARGRRRLQYRHVQFASQYLLDAVRDATGGRQPGWEVIHWGVDAERFSPRPDATTRGRRLLYVGQVMRHKGVHTAIEAVRILRQEYGYHDATLDVVGDGSGARGYVKRLRRTIARTGLGDAVRLRGVVDRWTLPQLYRDHDVLIFPSVWNEPFSITVLEAMASGVPVVGTLTGGSGEALRHDENALTFRTEDARACADQLRRLFADDTLYDRVRANARRMILEELTIERMIDAIETSLRSVQAPKAAGSRLG